MWASKGATSDIVDKMRKIGVLDEQTAKSVRSRLAEGNTLGQALLASGMPEEQILRYLADEFRNPYVDLEQYDPSKKFLSQFPARLLLDKHILPVEDAGGSL